MQKSTAEEEKPLTFVRTVRMKKKTFVNSILIAVSFDYPFLDLWLPPLGVLILFHCFTDLHCTF